MSNDNEIRITAITVAPDAKILKGYGYDGKQWGIPTTFTLADGRQYAASTTARLKRDVLGQLEKDRANAASGAMVANFLDGEFHGTITKFMIGAGGLVPEPQIAPEPPPEPVPALYRTVHIVEDLGWETIESDDIETHFARMDIRGYAPKDEFETSRHVRRELQGQPKFAKLCGPMFDGHAPDGRPVVRYESREVNERLSA